MNEYAVSDTQSQVHCIYKHYIDHFHFISLAFLMHSLAQAQFKYIIKHRPDQMTANQMCCSKHNICNAKTDPIDFTIEYDREPVFKAPKTYNFDENTLNQGAMITVLHLSDFRYDPLYAPGSNSRCMESACCRNSSTVSLRMPSTRARHSNTQVN